MIPLIFVTDFDRKPEPLTLHYIRGEHEIEFRSIFVPTRDLRYHPGRGSVRPHFSQQGGAVVAQYHLQECSEEFLQAFWTCAGKIVDYFLEFHRYDTAFMQAMWFRLLDVLKEVAKLPHNDWQAITPVCAHSAEFVTDWEATLELINDFITGDQSRTDEVIDMSGIIAPADTYMGGFRSGLKPWEQFLANKSPGFQVPEASRAYTGSNLIAAIQNPDRSWAIPMGAMAIMDRHRKKMRVLTEKAAMKAGEDVADALAQFDSRCIKLDQPTSYTSLEGHKTVVQPMQPSRFSKFTPRRDPAPPAPSDSASNPDFNDMDRYVGQLKKGYQPFTHPLGNTRFHMLSVTQSTQENGHDGEEQQKKIPNAPSLSRDLFDEWKYPETG